MVARTLTDMRMNMNSDTPSEMVNIRKSLFKLEGFAESLVDGQRVFVLHEINNIRALLNDMEDDYFTEIEDDDPKSMGWVGSDGLP
jgi:hypothetical protein